jgi:hypothetical protein
LRKGWGKITTGKSTILTMEAGPKGLLPGRGRARGPPCGQVRRWGRVDGHGDDPHRPAVANVASIAQSLIDKVLFLPGAPS